MKTSRRRFLNTAAVTAASVAFGPWKSLADGVLSVPSVSAQKGLLFDPSDKARIRKATAHPRFSPYWKSIFDVDLEVDKRFLRTELRLNNHVADFLKAHQILERTSFVYSLTGEKRHLEVAMLAIERLFEYKRWDYFLEGGEHTIGLQRAPGATIAMSFAREWLDDVLSSDLKNEIEKQIAEKGAPACYRTLYGMKYPDRVRGWGFDPEDDYPYRFDLRRWPFILNATNLKVIPICGLGIAACLLYDKHPQAPQWLALALQSARAFAPMFGPDGSYDEGVSYWGYTALHMTMFLEVLYRKLGQDERDLINYPGTVRYGLQMSMPTAGKSDDCVNFGDASIVGDVSVAAWVARKHRDAVAQYVATSVGEIRTHYAMIWFDSQLEPKKPGLQLFDVRFSNDVVVSRTGWGQDDSVVALRSGGPANHEHADRNSVIFKAYGERLLHDPLKAAYSYTLQHWILRQTEAHTAVLIDGKGHQYHDGHEGTNASWAEAKVMQYKPSAKHLIVTSDATEAYRLVNPDVQLVSRTVVFLKPDVLILFDHVRMATVQSKVQLRFQIYHADEKGFAEITDGVFRIKRPLASVRGTTSATTPHSVRTGRHEVPADIGIYPYVETEMKEALDHRIVTVLTAQKTGKDHGTVVLTSQGTTWVVKTNHNGQQSTVSIDSQQDLPVIVIS